jgi:maltooligosyltrehalose trehalohydrolase
VRDLLSIRRHEIVPRLAGAAFGEAAASDNGLLTSSWRLGDGSTLGLIANLSPVTIARETQRTTGTAIWGGEPGKLLPPWSVYWTKARSD